MLGRNDKRHREALRERLLGWRKDPPLKANGHECGRRLYREAFGLSG
jgi:hypothetical protein